MRKTILALAAATLLGGLTLGTAPASAAQAGVQLGDVPTAYSQMTRGERMMMRQRMMRNRMMMRRDRMMRDRMMMRRDRMMRRRMM